ncbi:uncharacterized protein GIQ15_02522 [Arthroderma uncinatum]|uniref:uncharacterized protein n=1 Tax=Arthroderma uncinatum TaxID=74035 RepID=UPI00144A61EC|nr:uncharacterized protein GIQ15_02522 [Arthroderma uncinatum]KAF3483198.1 hypothetical protein GIQ15_02522 [Arthroderma uncinatum]
MGVNSNGLNFSYETFCAFLPRITGGSSSPTNTDNVNPLIQQILTIYPGSTIYAAGGHSALLSIGDDICVKVSYKPGGEHIRHEQTIFMQLESVPCPFIAHSLLCAPDLIFMELYKNGTLHEPCLEDLGYAHGDINPRNIMFIEGDHLRLVDFDHALRVGDDVEVGDYPYVRPVGANKGNAEHGGSFGIAGADTEQFALGSIFWDMVQGTGLWTGVYGPDLVDRLTDRVCPEMDLEDPINQIMNDCWKGKFESIAALAARIRHLAFEKDLEQKKKACEKYYKLICGAVSEPEARTPETTNPKTC